MTLVEFLRARLAEDQQWARAAAEGDGYAGWDVPSTGVVQVAGGDLDGLVVAPCEAAHHIARHDPARVLAEVEAKRRIVHAHDRPHHCSGEQSVVDGQPWELWEDEHTENTEGVCYTLRLLALPDADHPDYDPTWRP